MGHLNSCRCKDGESRAQFGVGGWVTSTLWLLRVDSTRPSVVRLCTHVPDRFAGDCGIEVFARASVSAS